MAVKSGVYCNEEIITAVLAGSGGVAIGGTWGTIEGRPAVALVLENVEYEGDRVETGGPVPANAKTVGPPLKLIFLEVRGLDGVIRHLGKLRRVLATKQRELLQQGPAKPDQGKGV